MGQRKIEIILLPRETGKVKRFGVPYVAGALIILLFMSCATLLVWMGIDYAGMKFKAFRAGQLTREIAEQREEYLRMSAKVIRIVEELDNLEAIDGEDEVVINLERAYDDIQVRRMAERIHSPLLPQHPLSDAYAHLARQMQSALTYVESEMEADAPSGTRFAGSTARVWADGRPHAHLVAFGEDPGSRAAIKKKLRAIAMELGLAPRLALSMAKVESGYDHRAVSPKGAIGLLQLRPQFVCQQYEVTPEMLFNPDVNIRVGLSYMKSLLKRFDEDLDLSLAAYNAGPRRVVEAGYEVPPYEETQDFVRKVKETMRDGIDPSLPQKIYLKQNPLSRNPS